MSAYPKMSGNGRFGILLRRSFTWKSCLRFAAALGLMAIVNLLLPDDVGGAVQNPMGRPRRLR